MKLFRKSIQLPLLFSIAVVAGCSQSSSNLEAKKNIIKRIDFMSYQFVYYEDGSGSLHSQKNDTKTIDFQNIEFKESNIDKIKSSNSFEDIIENIGFPRFSGISDTLTLDFGEPDADIYRISFSEEGLYEKLDVFDYNNPSCWMDPAKKKLPTRDDINNIKVGMSLDTVVSIIGKAQGSSGYGAIIYHFAIDDGSCLTTWWGPKVYTHRNGPYYLDRMIIDI